MLLQFVSFVGGWGFYLDIYNQIHGHKLSFSSSNLLLSGQE